MNERRRIIKHTDITVDRSPVDRVLVPYDRVDELHEASKTGPGHVQTSACIPSYVVILRKSIPMRWAVARLPLKCQ